MSDLKGDDALAAGYDGTELRPRADPAVEPSTLPPAPVLGRVDELHHVLGLLAPGGPRVVNVTGAPGIGKSALVDAVVAEAGDGFDRVQRLDLTGTPPDGVLSAVRSAVARLPAPLRRVRPPASAGDSLLVIDRGDVLAGHAHHLVDLVTRAGSLTVLVESVPPLRAPGCAPVTLGPLAAPDAARLFRRSAALVGQDLGGDPATIDRVARICAAVDGNPLAVELAAARLPSLALADLDAALSSPQRALSVLSSPRGGGPRGHRLLRTLTADQATATPAHLLLDLLSTFAGPFSLEGVEAVGGGLVDPCYDALDELVDLRLVELGAVAGEGLYRLPRLVRAFAAGRLDASPYASAARTRHAAYVCHLARRAAQAVEAADEETAAAVLGTSHVDAVEVIRRLAPHEPVTALQLAADLAWHTQRHGTGDWLATLLEELCSTVTEGVAARRDALLWLVRLRIWSPGAGDRVGLITRHLEEGLDLARRLADPLPLLQALRTRFLAVVATGDVAAAMAACREGMALASHAGHARWLGRFEISLSSMHCLRREHDAAAGLAGSGLDRALRCGDRRAVVLASLVLDGLPNSHRDHVQGVPSLRTVLALTRELGDDENETHVLAALAHRAVVLGDGDEAASWVVARQEHLGRTEPLHGLTVSVMLGVQIALLRGDLRGSARLHGAIAAHAEPLLPLLSQVQLERYQQALGTVRTRLGPTAFDAAVAEGRVLDRRQTLVALLQHLDDPAGAVPQQRTRDTGPLPTLTPREEQVLALLADGLRNKEIAERLHVAPKTVMHHTAAIYRKLAVRGRTEAVTAGVRLGLVTVG